MQYHKTGLLAIRERRILLCRKKGLSSLILPGGRFERGETPHECLARELREELGPVTISVAEYLGDYVDRAAGDASSSVRIELYRGDLEGEPQPSSEIVELVWFGEEDDRFVLAPSIVNKILPDLIARGVLPWRA